MRVVGFTHYGKYYQMTEEQIEAAYRFQERRYRLKDAERHLYQFIAVDSCVESREELQIGDISDFEKHYEITLGDALDMLNEFVEHFEDGFDCNVAENSQWYYAIENVLTAEKNLQ